MRPTDMQSHVLQMMEGRSVTIQNVQEDAMKISMTRLSLIAVPLLFATQLFVAFGSDASDAEPGSIYGNVYCDADKNGTCDCEEHGLQGIPIQIYVEHCGGTAIQTVSTDEKGDFSFRNFESGTYFIRARLDYVCGGRMPTTASCQEVKLAAGETVNLPPFGYSEYGQ